MTISDEKYVASTTYRKSGAAVTTPTWIVGLDGGQVAVGLTARNREAGLGTDIGPAPAPGTDTAIHGSRQGAACGS